MIYSQKGSEYVDVRSADFEREDAPDASVMRTDNPDSFRHSKGKTAEMPYERFLSCGASSLTNAELVAIILRTGTKEKTATQLSRDILGFYEEGCSDLSALHRLTYELGNRSAENVAELIVAKQRNGPLDTIKLNWLSECTMFTDRKIAEN